MHPANQLASVVRTTVAAKQNRFLVLPDAVDEIMARNPGLATSRKQVSDMVVDAALNAGVSVGIAWDD